MIRTVSSTVIVLLASLPILAGCPGCGGFSGQAGSTALGIIGSLSSGMGDPANVVVTSFSRGSYGTQDTEQQVIGAKYNLNHWLGLHLALSRTSSEGSVELPWASLTYRTSGWGDTALAVTADITGRTRFTPCPVDGNFLPIKDFFHVLAIAGTSIPTGKYDFEDEFGLYPSEYQLGTGTYDPFAGVGLFKRWGRWQPQLAVLYKFSGGTNDAGYWRDDALLGRLDLIYFINPLNKMILNACLTYSRVGRDERNYNWGTEEMFLEIDGTSGNTLLGSLTWGMEIVKRLSINASITASLREPSTPGSTGKSIGNQYSLGLTYRFGD